MVVPSMAKLSKSRRYNRRVDILAVIVATLLAVTAGWIVATSLLGRSDSPELEVDVRRGHFAPPAAAETEEGGDGPEGPVATDTRGEMHLSASAMLASKRPYMMYGTAWKKDETADLVIQAVHAGFRFIDTACQPRHYDEAAVGIGWKMAADQLGLRRDDVFLQTKFTSVDGQDPNDVPYTVDAKLEDQVRQSVFASLRNLKTDYIDSLVLHSPMPTMEETMRVWNVLEDYVARGKIRQLGISNCYSAEKFRRLYREAKVKPSVLQNRFYRKSGFDVELRRICGELGVQYQSFWTLTGNRDALKSRDWRSLAREKGLTPQTLMYAFMMTLGHTPLSGTKNSGHMMEDVDVMLRFQHGENILSDDDVNMLSSLIGIS